MPFRISLALLLFGMLLRYRFTQATQFRCSRDRSRMIRKYLSKEIFPYLSINATLLPQSCQLNPLLDVYLDQESHKQLEPGKRTWTCRYCRKIFKNEFYLDRHMDNKHEDKLLNNASAVCLSDLCPIFGCSKSTVSRSSVKSEINAFDSIQRCDDAELEKIKYRCEVISRRCFSGIVVDGKTQKIDIMKRFNSHICDKLHCGVNDIEGILSDDKSKESSMQFFKYLLMGLLLLFVCVYAMVTDVLGLAFRKGSSSKASISSRNPTLAKSMASKYASFVKSNKD